MGSTLHLHAERPEDVERAAALLRAGGLVAFPTETVYGLGANALSAQAVRGIFAAKKRPSWDPLIVHVAEFAELTPLTDLSGPLLQRVQSLAAAFWPGPLTMLLPRSGLCPDEVTAGRATVGVRLPAHPVAQALLRAAGIPVAAPSANLFGHVSPTTAEHVLHDLDGRIAAVLDGGPAQVGLESTVLDPALTPMVIYRAGAISAEAISAVTGTPVQLYEATGLTVDPIAANSDRQREGLPSPGVGLRHYAPETPLRLTGPTEAELAAAAALAMAQDESVCVLLPENWKLAPHPRLQIVPWGHWESPAALAFSLFGALRQAENCGATVILCPFPQPGGLRDALRDRLGKAAKPRQVLAD